MKRNLKKVLEGKAKKVRTNWYFEKKFKKRTSIERISILNWRVRLIRTLKLKLILKKKKKKLWKCFSAKLWKHYSKLGIGMECGLPGIGFWIPMAYHSGSWCYTQSNFLFTTISTVTVKNIYINSVCCEGKKLGKI